MLTRALANPSMRARFLVAALLASPLAAACGSDTDDAAAAPGGAEASSEDGGMAADGSFDVDVVATCLTNAGFDVTREADQANPLPDDYKESIGLIESLDLGFLGDVKGLGSVGFFENVSSALDEFDAASGFRTDDVLAGTVGTANWDYMITSGDDPGAKPMIEGCLNR